MAGGPSGSAPSLLLKCVHDIALKLRFDRQPPGLRLRSAGTTEAAGVSCRSGGEQGGGYGEDGDLAHDCLRCARPGRVMRRGVPGHWQRGPDGSLLIHVSDLSG